MASPPPSSPPSPNERWLNRGVAGAGVTSALGDFCYETTTVILPGFLAVLGIPAVALGVIEGLADMVAAFTKMGAGFVADKLGRRKQLVLLGYALTPVGQALLALASGWPLLLAGRLVSWFGKGLRSPLRDAIVLQIVSPTTRGRAFGFHRAMDGVGSVVGPLLGVALLGWAQSLGGSDPSEAFRWVLALSLIPGVLAVGAFAWMVNDPGQPTNPGLQLFGALKDLPARFKRYLVAVGLFGLGDFSHSLLILAATHLLTPEHGVVRAAQTAGLLYVLRNGVQVVASYPVGALADRVGASPLLVLGYVVGVATAALTAAAFHWQLESLPVLAGVFVLAGLYTAIQEALESPVTAELIGRDTLSLGIGTLGTVNGIAKFASSAGIGLLWSLASPELAFLTAAALMAGGTLALTSLVRR